MVLYLTESTLSEEVSPQQVIDALNNRTGVLISYNDGTGKAHPGKRYIEPYVYGITKAGNPCIRAYQYFGDTKSGTPSWKMFRLDRIQSWIPTGEKFDVEPQARGWAAQAFNDGGDKSMSAVYNIIDLNGEAQTPDETLTKLRARTRQLQNSKPLTIDQFKDRLQYPEEVNAQRQEAQQKSGPIKTQQNQQVTNTSPVQQDNQDNKTNPVNGNGEVEPQKGDSPIKNTESQSGPITNDNNSTTGETQENQQMPDAQSSSPEELMSNDMFQKMLQRNLELSKQEREKQKNWRNQYKP